VAQEALLPDTHAIKRGEMECVPYRGRWLVRWKDGEGNAHQEKFPTVDEAFPRFLELVNHWREASSTSRPTGNNLSKPQN
jgi:hypothetical protein